MALLNETITGSKKNKISIKVAFVVHPKQPDAIEAFLNVGKEQKFGEKFQLAEQHRSMQSI